VLDPDGLALRGKNLATSFGEAFLICEVAPKWVSWSDKMKHQRHFWTGNRSREASQTRKLIADIERVFQLLNIDIADEDEKAAVFDRTQAEYPILARTLAARRDNLQGTIAALKKRVEYLSADAAI
jgi:hypothetical protein